MTTAPSPFQRLAPYIREFIYRQGWKELRGMQVEAIHAILDTRDHVLLAGQTASGKTEAAFLPILTDLERDPSTSIGVLYVGPLKALINDQFQRLDHLLEEAEIPVWPWHGDVSQSVKNRAVKTARGVMQITPESLEGFMLFRKEQLHRLFHDLRYVVIDEVHAFMASDRGGQLQCLLERITSLTGARFRRVGLSATLGDYDDAGAWLAGATSAQVRLIEGEGGRKLKLALHHYQHDPDAEERDSRENADPSLLRRIYQATRTGKSLVFVNSRARGEQVVAGLQALAEQEERPGHYFVHHGSVSKEYRLAAEEAMRRPNRSACTVATVTLELGIDLGQLDRVVQVNAPGSVSSFVQRIGRTGRRGQVGEVLILTEQGASSDADSPLTRLPWDLLRAIASVELHRTEKWVEPVPAPELPVSLLYHQTMSILVQRGDLPPKELAAQVLALPPFTRVGKERYQAFLNHLLRDKHLELTETNTLLVGLAAEKIVNHYQFLATFEDPNEFRVVSGSRTVGTLPAPPPADTQIRLAGRSWRVVDVDVKRRLILVQPTRGKASSTWLGEGPPLHPRVAQRMRDLLSEDLVPAYLDERAETELSAARRLARELGILEREVFFDETGTLIVPWGGTLAYRRLRLRLTAALGSGRVQELLPPHALRVSGDAREALAEEVPLEALAAAVRPDELEDLGKYARFAPEALLREAFVRDLSAPPPALT